MRQTSQLSNRCSNNNKDHNRTKSEQSDCEIEIARIVYRLLCTRESNNETVFHNCEEEAMRRPEMRLRTYKVDDRLCVKLFQCNAGSEI